jgi:hypothetical protein
MTPDQFIDALNQLIAQGRDQESLDFARTHGDAVQPPLSPEQIDHIGGMLEGSVMLVKMREFEAAHRAGRSA